MKQTMHKADSYIPLWSNIGITMFNLTGKGVALGNPDTNAGIYNTLYQSLLLSPNQTEKYTTNTETYSFSHCERPTISGHIGKWIRFALYYIDGTLTYIRNKKKAKGNRALFKDSVIYLPTDDSAIKRLYKTISAFRCNAAMQYMDKLGFDDDQKGKVIDGLLYDMNQTQQSVFATV